MYKFKDESMVVPMYVWSAKDSIEENAITQMKNVSSLQFAYHHTALMPDGHSGYGAPIGCVLATKGIIVPFLVGVDIGCGMIAVKTTLREIDTDTIKSIMGKTREVIPVGFNHQTSEQTWEGFSESPNVSIIQRELVSSKKQLGTLGGGNHFIEIQKGDDGYIWLMIHSGSRNFGLKTASEYHKKAQALCERWNSNIPDKELSFLPIETDEGHQYFDAMNYCLRFAQANRALMMSRLCEIVNKATGADKLDEINIHHNYAVFENHYGKDVLIHRKGATKANIGLRGIIPGSMGTSSYIVEGLGNEESFQSCSHGAGRRMGRGEATRTLNLEEEQKKMAGIVHGLRTSRELDEAPGSYKPIDEVMKNQEDLTHILVKLTPLGNIKG